VIVAMWLVDPWFADQRERVAVRVAFNPRLQTGPAEPALGPAVPCDADQSRRPGRDSG
jgi:hypothetical protein